ncbi:MAG: fused response regulator/phosphatase [Pseudomonadota bacterium]
MNSVVEKILIVDDNATNLQVLYKTLNQDSYKIYIAKNGLDAIAITRKIKPALILLDIMMPEMDGYETCEKIREDESLHDIAIIFLSALDEPVNKVKGLQLGAVDYITKPFQADEVLARIKIHLKIKNLEKDLKTRNKELENFKNTIAKDLDAASRVQKSLLPTMSPMVANARFAWAYRPSTVLAGDSLNYVQLNSRFIALFLLDVSGHGVASALLSVSVSRAISQFRDPSSLIVRMEPDGVTIACPNDVAKRLNHLYPMMSNGAHYFTMVYGLLDLQKLQFRFVTAGHPGPILVRRGGDSQFFDIASFPIGVVENPEYEDHILQLEPGDRLYMYSDGIYEAKKEETKEEFGRTRMLNALKAASFLPLNSSIDALLEKTQEWHGQDSFTDDVSVLAIEIPQNATIISHEEDSPEAMRIDI